MRAAYRGLAQDGDGRHHLGLCSAGGGLGLAVLPLAVHSIMIWEALAAMAAD